MKPHKNPILVTIILCIVMLLVTFPKHAGFMLGFWVLFIVPSIIKSLYIILVKNTAKKQRLIQILLWVISFTAVAAHHVYLHQTTRVYAISVASRITQFYEQHAVYPSTIEEVGIKKEELLNHKLYYSNRENEPFLMYPATWIPFDTYYYDFKSRTWNLKSS